MLRSKPARLLLEYRQFRIFRASHRVPTAAPPRRCLPTTAARGFLPALFHSMSLRKRETDVSTQAPKKRRTSYGTREVMTHATQAQASQPPVNIQLTPIENTLKALLLDVGQYIRNHEIAQGGGEDLPQTELRFTGGWVRDKLLGVDSQDIDVGISNMTGYQFGMALKEYLDTPGNLDKYKKNHPDGELSEAIVSLHKIEANPEKSKHLETVTTKIFGLEVDLVNLRKETYSDESRNPQMEFGTAQEDAMRRDATINALFYNLNESKVEDLTERGFSDMQNKIVRTPLEPFQTFKDDPLRVLRLIRFASRLGYRIHEDTERAMQNDEISDALKLKISKERVGTELEKMLRGPDPRGALETIDRIGLYPTIFANHQDDVHADTSSWSLAYNTLEKLLHPVVGDSEGLNAVIERVRNILIRDKSEIYSAWVIAAFAPWIPIPGRLPQGPKAKPLPPRAAEVARDSLRSDNKTITFLKNASDNWRSIIDIKSSFLEGRMNGTAAEIRQQIGLHIREWSKDWRICFLSAILQEVMQGRDFSEGEKDSKLNPDLEKIDPLTYVLLAVIQEHDTFLAYIKKEGLEGVCELKPIINGADIMQALKASKGPWMRFATEMVVKWQLLHPEITEKEKALEAISEKREELGLPPAT